MIADEPIAELIDLPLVPRARSSSNASRLPACASAHELCIAGRLRSTPCTLLSLDRKRRRKVTSRLGHTLTFAFPLHIVPRMLPLTKRQREILDYLNDFIQQHGYAPSLEEIGRRFSLSSLATVHKHLTNLQEKGFIKRAWNRSRSVEMVPARARRPRGRTADAGLRRRRLPDRGGRRQRDAGGAGRSRRQARLLRAQASAAIR